MPARAGGQATLSVLDASATAATPLANGLYLSGGVRRSTVDLLIPIAERAIGAEHIVADLAEVVRGAAVRTADADVTVFESVGMAFEDLVVARAALDAAG